MIDRGHDLPLSGQVRVLGISRGTAAFFTVSMSSTTWAMAIPAPSAAAR